MHYSVNESEIDLVQTDEEEEVLYLALEEDGEHPYIHFPHCKVYLVLSLGWIILITLSLPIAIGYARPALLTYDLEASQCTIKTEEVKAAGDDNWRQCRTTDAQKNFECALSRSQCQFAEIPICFQKPCRCLQIKVDVITKGKESKSKMIYDYEDTYVNYPMCSISPCSDDYAFDELLTAIKAGNKQLRCYANEHVAIYYPKYRDNTGNVVGALVVPLLLILIWSVLSLYVVKRTWRVTKQDFKQAVEFRFTAWPPRPAHSIRASVPNTMTRMQ